MNLKDGMYVKKITIMKLSRLTGVHHATISNYRMGHKVASPKHVKKIEQALDLRGCIQWTEHSKGER